MGVKRVKTRRERRMMARKVKTKRVKRVKRRRARVTNKPSQCFNLDCTERGELFSRLDNYQYSSYKHPRKLHLLNKHSSSSNQITCETFLISPIFVDNSIQLPAS